MKDNYMKKLVFTIVSIICFNAYLTRADDGYKLWLKYSLIKDTSLLKEYKTLIHANMVIGESSTIKAAKDEFQNALSGLLGLDIPQVNDVIFGLQKDKNSRNKDKYPYEFGAVEIFLSKRIQH
jgi:hypothetical protein